MQNIILGPDGKLVQSERVKPCPKCGRGPDARVPSGSFGDIYLICPCGKEFKELKWERSS